MAHTAQHRVSTYLNQLQLNHAAAAQPQSPGEAVKIISRTNGVAVVQINYPVGKHTGTQTHIDVILYLLTYDMCLLTLFVAC